jgi:valyl-tRNA synthetase
MSETPAVLLHVFTEYLRLFHPFIPFVTEQIWTELGRPGMLIRADWPAIRPAHAWPDAVTEVEAVVRLIGEIRRLRSEMGVDQKTKVNVEVQPRANAEVFARCAPVITRLARVETFAINASPEVAATARRDASVAVDAAFTAAITLGQADIEAERARLAKQLEVEQNKLAGLEKRLSNEGFLTKAKPEAIASAREEAAKASATIASLNERLQTLA